MALIRYGKTAQIGVYPGNQSGRFISYRSGSRLPSPPFGEDTTLWLPFYASKSLLDVVSGVQLGCTRPSQATYYDQSGTLQVAQNNEARFDHDPITFASLGLLVEEPRTNEFLNSGAPVTQGITTVADTYVVQVWGAGDITVSGSAVGVATEGNPLIVAASAGTMTCTVNGSLSRAQVELGPFPSSYIPTAGVTVTRAADDVGSADVTWLNTSVGSWYTSYDRKLGTAAIPFSVDDGTVSNKHEFISDGNANGAGNANYFVQGNAATQFTNNFSTAESDDQENRVASAYQLNDSILYVNELPNPAPDQSGTPPVSINRVIVGRRGSNNTIYVNGHIRAAGYGDVRASNTYLEWLTGPRIAVQPTVV